MKRLLLGAVLTGIIYTAPSFAQPTMYGITNTNSIFTMGNVNAPSSISGPYSISGVASGQTLVGLSSRSSNARLYALGYDSTSGTGQLYWISHTGTTYTANAVGSATMSMDLGSTNNVSFSFVASTANQIRITGRNGNNYIMNADNGSVMSTGGSTLSYGSGDIYAGSSGAVAATGYTNNFFGSDNTQQFGYDATNNVMVMFDAGNYANHFDNASYTMHSVGATTGVLFNSGSSIGMDSWYDSVAHTNTAYLSGSTLLGGTHLYKYALNGTATGLLTDMGAIGGGTTSVRAITFDKYRDSTSAITGHLMAALTLNLRNIVWFDSDHPGNIRRMISISGMTSGQNMVAIDFSPATGIMYGLGYNSSAQTYQLYTINQTTGAVSAVNTTAASLNLGTDDGSGNRITANFRFIPTLSNRIRVMGNNGNTNVQLNAATGAVVSTDASTQYVTGDADFGLSANISSIAYTGYNGDTATQGFGFDANTGAMVMFNADNTASGYGDGSNGYISSSVSLNTILSLLLHNSSYNNTHMDIAYDNTSSLNVGYMASNFYGDSSNQLNYSVMYDMTGMLTGYHKGTSATPSQTGTIGAGVPVKDVAVYQTGYTGPTAVTGVSGIGNDILLYPNPVENQARIVLPQASIGTVTVDVIDLNGNVTRSYSYAPGSYQLDVDMSRLPAGMYSVRVFGKGVVYHNIKVIKED